MAPGHWSGTDDKRVSVDYVCRKCNYPSRLISPPASGSFGCPQCGNSIGFEDWACKTRTALLEPPGTV